MPTSQVTVHFPCPVERVWPTAADLFHTGVFLMRKKA